MFGISAPTIAFLFICTTLGYMYRGWEGAIVGLVIGGLVTYLMDSR